ncbi:MerC domain-containing protein [Seonamhaeicola sp. ML3]|uniref:MerC domain-containing protein n=1 Tax=Seonamhaeicola sp. ML3 TaxID=2937786 RepID=UPI0021133B34|nr:MerC domain-containing protein [Seonamhaeicola sp. ML3]
MKLLLQKSDTIGAFSSGLCMVHCLATPLLFIAHASSLCCDNTVPTWWKSIDYFFLVVSFFAVYRSTQTTSKSFIKPIMWFCWILLCLTIINESIQLIPIKEIFNYIPAISLIILHIYNLKFCQCKTENCCTN